ncbi:MAG: Zn-dependent hydrolase, glyoxylase [Conexibacter sp.]|nr:Zn-dependent hydrolase, glyoxylase [Conexibacter sp.]
MVSTRLSILDLGRLHLDLGWQLAMPAPSTTSTPNPPRERLALPVLGVVVQTAARTILFDTGCHPDAMKGRWTPRLADTFSFRAEPEQTLEAQLALLGLTPAAVTDVVLSHLHMDHAGNVEALRHAKVWVHRGELEFALAESLTTPDYTGPYISADWLLPDLDWRYVHGPAVVDRGVEVFPLRGHAPGVLCMQVELASGTFLFPSDSVYMRESLGPPPCAPGVIHDSVGFRETVDRITYLRDHHDATIVFPHDPEQLATLSTAPHWYV